MAAGCHWNKNSFRPYSFAALPFDSFALYMGVFFKLDHILAYLNIFVKTFYRKLINFVIRESIYVVWGRVR